MVGWGVITLVSVLWHTFEVFKNILNKMLILKKLRNIMKRFREVQIRTADDLFLRLRIP